MSTEKRQRQRAAREAKLAAEAKARKRKQSIRRGIIIVIALALIIGISLWVTSGGSSDKASSNPANGTTSVKYTTTSTGGSGDTSPSAITTSADCPADFTTTLNKPDYKTGPKMTIDTSKTYTATVTTDVGSFDIQLNTKDGPIAANNFVYLANNHFFDCIVFHRVIQGFMDQTGDPQGSGTGGPGYQFAEAGPPKASPQYPLGSVAMANSGAGTNGSQFFIVTGSAGESLGPNYTLFGKVTSGMDVVQKINSDGAPSDDPTGTGKPTTLHRMISVTVKES